MAAAASALNAQNIAVPITTTRDTPRRSAKGTAACEAEKQPMALIAKASENPVRDSPHCPEKTTGAEAMKMNKMPMPRVPANVRPTKRGRIIDNSASITAKRNTAGCRVDPFSEVRDRGQSTGRKTAVWHIIRI